MPFPVDEKYIIETEKELGKGFPSWFRIKMMSENGGQIEAVGDVWEIYPFWNKASKKVMKRTADDILRNTKSALEWETFPRDAVAIATNGTGDLLVFLPENETHFSNTTHHWNHETGEVAQVRSK
jgi:hypothetical protein